MHRTNFRNSQPILLKVLVCFFLLVIFMAISPRSSLAYLVVKPDGEIKPKSVLDNEPPTLIPTTSIEKIEKAYADGLIDYPESMDLKFIALMHPSQLPVQYLFSKNELVDSLPMKC
jgi:hypothetical protein